MARGRYHVIIVNTFSGKRFDLRVRARNQTEAKIKGLNHLCQKYNLPTFNTIMRVVRVSAMS